MSISPRLDYSRQRADEAQFRTGLVIASVVCAGASIILLAFLALGPMLHSRPGRSYTLLVYCLSVICALAGLVVGVIAILMKRLGGWFVTLFNLFLLLALLGFAALVVIGFSPY
jgi:hypothetical protein